MKLKNKATGLPQEIPDEIWNEVKDLKHIKGVLIPVEKPKVPEEVTALNLKKAEREAKKEAERLAKLAQENGTTPPQIEPEEV